MDIDQWTGDIHHTIGNADGLHWYYAFQRDLRGEPTLQLNTIPGFGDTRHSHRQIMTLNETHVFGPKLVNEARFGFNRIDITFDPNAKLNPIDYGINDGVTTAIGIPQITIVGLGLNFGGPSNFPPGAHRHQLRVFRYRRATSAGGSPSSSAASSAASWPTASPPTPAHFSSAASRLSRPAWATTSTLRWATVQPTSGSSALGLFVQDSLRASSNLSFELGLRYDAIMAPSETDDRFVVFDAATDSLVQSANPVSDRPQPAAARRRDLEPAQATTGLVVRGAYAVMVDQPVANVVSVTSANPPLATPLNFAGDIRLDSAAATALASGLAPTSVDPNFESGRMQTWNVNVERQIGPALGVMAGYFGSKGDRLRITRNVNQFVNGVRPYPTLSASSPILPGGALGNVIETDSLGWSHYKGLWLSANERPFKGLQFNASYTLAKSTDTNSLSTAAIVVQDSNNIADSEGPSDFDVRHRFVINAIYELPFKGNRFAEGWQIGIITQAQTGGPVHIVTGINTFTGVNNTPAAGPRRRSGHRRIDHPMVQQRGLRSADRHRRRRVHEQFRVRAAGIGQRRVPLRQSRAQRRLRPGLRQHGSVDHQESGARGQRAAAVPHRGVQHLQPGEPRPAGPHCDGRQHVVRRDHQHALPDWRLGIGAAGAVRREGAVLEVFTTT